MYGFDLEIFDPIPEGPTEEDVQQLQLITASLDSCLNTIEDIIFKMKDLDVCHSVNCEGWDVESLIAANKFSPIVADETLILPKSSRNINLEELTVHLEMDFIYNAVKFIKDIIRAIFTGVKEALTWFFSQFKPSTHYHAMLKSRKRNVLSDIKMLDTAAFKKTVLLMEPHDVTVRKTGALLLIYDEVGKILKAHTSVMDDTTFEHRRVFDEPLKTLGYAIDASTQRIKPLELQNIIESKPLEELGWSINNIHNSVDRIILVYEKQPVIKQLTKRLEELIDATKDTEKRMRKVTDDYSHLSKERDRIVIIQKEVLFLTSLGKVVINSTHRIAHQYISLLDKVESLKRK